MMAWLYDHIDRAAHHAPSEFHRISSLCYRRRRTRTITCLMSRISSFLPTSLPPSTKNPPQQAVLQQRSFSFSLPTAAIFLSSNQKAASPQYSTTITRTMSDSTTHSKKQCFATTESLRETVGVFLARHQRSFVASNNRGGKQKVYFCSARENER